MCIIVGKEHCKSLTSQHTLKPYQIGDLILFGYLTPLGLLFVPYGETIEVYGYGEYKSLDCEVWSK